MSLDRLRESLPNERQGAYLCTEARLWQCGDDDCDCSQVRVTRWYRNALTETTLWPIVIAEGTFRSDGEHLREADEVAAEMAEAEALATADQLRMSVPTPEPAP